MWGPLKPFLISAVVVAVLIVALVWNGGDRGAGTSLMVYCAAGMRGPMAAITRSYAREYGVTVQVRYGGSGTLLSTLQLTPLGDLYLAADARYVEIAVEKGLVAKSYPLAKQRPVIAVRRGNPLNIRGIDDLVGGSLRISLSDPAAAAIGKTTEALLRAAGKWDSIHAVVLARGVFKPTVTNVANDVKLGAADAGIVWDTTVAQYPELEGIAMANSRAFEQRITIGLLTGSASPEAAKHFITYLLAPSGGQRVFLKMGIGGIPAESELAGTRVARADRVRAR